MKSKQQFIELTGITYTTTTEFRDWCDSKGLDIIGGLTKSTTWDNLIEQWNNLDKTTISKLEKIEKNDKLTDEVEREVINLLNQLEQVRVATDLKLNEVINNIVYLYLVSKLNYLLKLVAFGRKTQIRNKNKQLKQLRDKEQVVNKKPQLTRQEFEKKQIDKIGSISKILTVNNDRYELTNDLYNLVIESISKIKEDRVKEGYNQYDLNYIREIVIKTVDKGSVRTYAASKTRTGGFPNSLGTEYESSKANNFGGKVKDRWEITDRDFEPNKHIKSIILTTNSRNEILLVRELPKLEITTLDQLNKELISRLSTDDNKLFIPKDKKGNRYTIRSNFRFNLNSVPIIAKRIKHFIGFTGKDCYLFDYVLKGGIIHLNLNYTEHYTETLPIGKLTYKSVVQKGWVDKYKWCNVSILLNDRQVIKKVKEVDHSNNNFTSTFNGGSYKVRESVIQLLNNDIELKNNLNQLFSFKSRLMNWKFELTDSELIAISDEEDKVLLATKVVTTKKTKLVVIPIYIGDITTNEGKRYINRITDQQEINYFSKVIGSHLIKRLKKQVEDINQKHNRDLDKNLRRTVKYSLVKSGIYSPNLNIDENLLNSIACSSYSDLYTILDKAKKAGLIDLIKYIEDKLTSPKLSKMISNISNHLFKLYGGELALSKAIEIKQEVKKGVLSESEILELLTSNEMLRVMIEKQHKSNKTVVVQPEVNSNNLVDLGKMLQDSILSEFR